jgi:hypothetical protein
VSNPPIARVDLQAQLRHAHDDVGADTGAVRVPAAVIELHETDAALHQPPREQAVVAERHLTRFGAIHLVSRRRLAGDVGQFRDARLHPVRHLVGRDARGGFRVADALALERVERADEIERLAPGLCVDPTRVARKQHGLALGAELHALVHRGQKAAAPAALASVRVVLSRHQDDKRGRSLLSLPRP